MKRLIDTVNGAINRYLTAPESHAAGRLGLFRIGYALFYLWVLTDYVPAYMANIPEHLLREVVILRVVPNYLPVVFFEGLIALLVAGLIFLFVGYKTRLATGVVLVSGGVLESFLISSGFEHGSIFLMGYIPFFMLIAGDWGATWSFDAVIRRRKGEATDPRDTSPRFVLPIHATLVVLAALFCTAGLYKAVPWTVGDNVFGYHFLETNIKLAKLDMPMNPFARYFVDYAGLDYFLRAFVVLFEGTFFLALVNRKLRAVYLLSGVTFNAINGAFLGVTFTPMLIVYGLFVDWHALAKRVFPQSAQWSWPSERVLAIGTGLAAIAVAGLWIETKVVHEFLTAGGALNSHSLWYPVVPVAIIGLAWSTWDLLRAGIDWVRTKPEMQTADVASP